MRPHPGNAGVEAHCAGVPSPLHQLPNSSSLKERIAEVLIIQYCWEGSQHRVCRRRQGCSALWAGADGEWGRLKRGHQLAIVMHFAHPMCCNLCDHKCIALVLPLSTPSHSPTHHAQRLGQQLAVQADHTGQRGRGQRQARQQRRRRVLRRHRLEREGQACLCGVLGLSGLRGRLGQEGSVVPPWQLTCSRHRCHLKGMAALNASSTERMQYLSLGQCPASMRALLRLSCQATWQCHHPPCRPRAWQHAPLPLPLHTAAGSSGEPGARPEAARSGCELRAAWAV